MKSRVITLIYVTFTLILICSTTEAQHGNNVAVVRGDLSGSAHIMLGNLGEQVDDYPQNADLWDKAESYWLIWVGWPNSNAAVKQGFKDNGDTFQAWLAAGGAFVVTTGSSNIQEIYELLPGTVRTTNAHGSIEEAHIADPNHKIVNEPNDVTDDAYYVNWAWTAGDVYTEWDEYKVIATRQDDPEGDPMWLVHEELAIVVTTMQPTWSGHMKPEMTENILEYVRNIEVSVEPTDKLAATWGSIKSD